MKFAVIFLLSLLILSAEDDVRLPGNTMFSSFPHLQKFEEKSKPVESSFKDFDSWKKLIGQKISLTRWKSYNKAPWRNYFITDSAECASRWYISLGPLGLHTLMHDRSWGVFKGQQQIFPRALCDGSELIFNHFEILTVKPGSPCAGKVQKGDLLLAIDNKPLLSAQNTYVGQELDNRNKRGLEIHAGQLIDDAEGRGSAVLTVLRLTDSQKKKYETLLNGKRKWHKLRDLKATETMKVDLPSCELARIKLGRGTSLGKVWLTNEKGVKHPLKSSRKKGSDNNTALEIPSGKWTLNIQLAKNSGKPVIIETSHKVPLPEELRKHLVKISIKLPKIGSFGSNFDPDSEKVHNYTRILAHRLAVQQESDGSWKAKSYASPSFYTSICGLALLSTGDPQYKEKIRKAAHYVAYGPNQDKWTYSNGTWLVFLSEYYLRTKDNSILPGIRKVIQRCRLSVLNDYTAGHSIGKPGYGGSGYIGGGGMLALGFAAASYTPAMNADDKLLLDRMLQRIQEIAPHGKVPYGRGGKKLETTPDPGQGGSCGTGPYFLASLIRGGTAHFTSTAGKRYSTAPFGSAENGHATQTLHFMWSMLSSANCSDDAYRASMNAYLWKFTSLREYDGFINENNYRTEYHNGDGVIGAPYFRTAGYLLILNAHKRNLAITGKPEFRSKSFKNPKILFHRDIAARNFYLRNWALAANIMGSKAPSSFRDSYAELKALVPDRNLGKTLGRLIQVKTVLAIKELLSMESVSRDISNAQICELIAGIGFRASCVPSATISEDKKLSKEEKKTLKKEQSKLKKLLASGKAGQFEHTLRISPFAITQSIPGLSEYLHLGVSNLKVTVKDSADKFLKTPLVKNFGNWKGEPAGKKSAPAVLQLKLADMNTSGKDVLEVAVSYELFGHKISYLTTIVCPEPEARNYVPFLTKYKVKGHLSTDYMGQASTKVVLANGDRVGCETRFRTAAYIPAGAPVEFEISPDSVWAHVVRSTRILDSHYNHISFKSVSGPDLSKDYQRGLKIGKEKQTAELSFTDSEVGSIYFDLGGGKLNRQYTVYLKNGESWKEVMKSGMGDWQYLIPARASGMKIVFEEGKELTFRKLSILKPTQQTTQGFW